MSKRSSLALVPALALFAAGAAGAVTQGFDYTGAEQQFEVPPFVTSVSIKAFGAAGWSGARSGGLGGEAEGTLAVTPGEILHLFVGGQGIAANGDHVVEGGGFNGGGDGQNNGNPNSVGGGGGASDVRQGGSDLEDRVLVAGGGGGSTDNDDGVGGVAFGGDGGGLVGADGGSCYPSSGGIAGTGGTQVAGGVPGGALGQGGNADGTMTPWNGGGGYYGGGVAPAHCGAAAARRTPAASPVGRRPRGSAAATGASSSRTRGARRRPTSRATARARAFLAEGQRGRREGQAELEVLEVDERDRQGDGARRSGERRHRLSLLHLGRDGFGPEPGRADEGGLRRHVRHQAVLEGDLRRSRGEVQEQAGQRYGRRVVRREERRCGQGEPWPRRLGRESAHADADHPDPVLRSGPGPRGRADHRGLGRLLAEQLQGADTAKKNTGEAFKAVAP